MKTYHVKLTVHDQPQSLNGAQLKTLQAWAREYLADDIKAALNAMHFVCTEQISDRARAMLTDAITHLTK